MSPFAAFVALSLVGSGLVCLFAVLAALNIHPPSRGLVTWHGKPAEPHAKDGWGGLL